MSSCVTRADLSNAKNWKEARLEIKLVVIEFPEIVFLTEAQVGDYPLGQYCATDEEFWENSLGSNDSRLL